MQAGEKISGGGSESPVRRQLLSTWLELTHQNFKCQRKRIAGRAGRPPAPVRCAGPVGSGMRLARCREQASRSQGNIFEQPPCARAAGNPARTHSRSKCGDAGWAWDYPAVHASLDRPPKHLCVPERPLKTISIARSRSPQSYHLLAHPWNTQTRPTCYYLTPLLC